MEIAEIGPFATSFWSGFLSRWFLFSWWGFLKDQGIFRSRANFSILRFWGSNALFNDFGSAFWKGFIFSSSFLIFTHTHFWRSIELFIFFRTPFKNQDFTRTFFFRDYAFFKISVELLTKDQEKLNMFIKKKLTSDTFYQNHPQPQPLLFTTL